MKMDLLSVRKNLRRQSRAGGTVYFMMDERSGDAGGAPEPASFQKQKGRDFSIPARGRNGVYFSALVMRKFWNCHGSFKSTSGLLEPLNGLLECLSGVQSDGLEIHLPRYGMEILRMY